MKNKLFIILPIAIVLVIICILAIGSITKSDNGIKNTDYERSPMVALESNAKDLTLAEQPTITAQPTVEPTVTPTIAPTATPEPTATPTPKVQVTKAPKQEEPAPANNPSVTVEVTLEQVEGMIAEGKNFTLIIAETTCPACIGFLPQIPNISGGYTVYVLEVDKMDRRALAVKYNNPRYTRALEQDLGMPNESFKYTPTPVNFRGGKYIEHLAPDAGIWALKAMMNR